MIEEPGYLIFNAASGFRGGMKQLPTGEMIE